MGANASSIRHRQLPELQNIADFRKLPEAEESYLIPEVPEKRRTTDRYFTVVFAVCILILLPFLIYTLVNSDVNRFIHGYDKCGNVCGENNSHVDGISCSGEDMSKKPFLQYRRVSYGYNRAFLEESNMDTFSPVDNEDVFTSEKCVEKCASDYKEIMNRCYPGKETDKDIKFDAFLKDVASDINKSAGYIVALCIIGFGFCIGMIFLFRYFVSVVVWVIIVGSLIGIIALTGLFWYLNANVTDASDNTFKVLAITFTIVSVILVILLICMFKRVQLVIRLFREAMKVIFGIPLILFEPFLTFVANGILAIIFIYLLIIMAFGAGTLQQVAVDTYMYAPNGTMLFALWFHIIICLWMEQFILGCQHMVIGGAVSAYYFSRNKSALVSPIYNSFYNLVRYHLGTVAVGSLIITIVTIIKGLIRGMTNNRQTRLLVDCCLGAIESFLKYLSKNAYIQTAMHGQSFYKSGKRAVSLLGANALSAIAINSVGDFVLFMAQLLIVICTVLVGVLIRDDTIDHFWAAILISAFVTFIVAHCFFTVFETAIDTIFLCFCEDNSMNDGMTRPYYMSTEFMQYIEDAKKTINDKSTH